jgi:hypothetical protein
MEYFSKDRSAMQEGFVQGADGGMVGPGVEPELGKEPGLPAQTFSPEGVVSTQMPPPRPQSQHARPIAPNMPSKPLDSKPAPWKFPPRPRVDPRRPKIDIDGDLGEPLKL